MNGQLQPGTVLVSQAQISYKVLALLGVRGTGGERCVQKEKHGVGLRGDL